MRLDPDDRIAIVGTNGQGKTTISSLDQVIDFEHLKWLAQNIEDSDVNGYKVVAMTKGGTFDTSDFRGSDGQGEDNGKTLVVFNTAEDVTLTKTNGGRQFGPSVLAPFSDVYLRGQAGFIDGFVVAKRFFTNGSNPSNLQMHGDTYQGTISGNPRK